MSFWFLVGNVVFTDVFNVSLFVLEGLKEVGVDKLNDTFLSHTVLFFLGVEVVKLSFRHGSSVSSCIAGAVRRDGAGGSHTLEEGDVTREEGGESERCWRLQARLRISESTEGSAECSIAVPLSSRSGARSFPLLDESFRLLTFTWK